MLNQKYLDAICRYFLTKNNYSSNAIIDENYTVELIIKLHKCISHKNDQLD